MKITKDYLRQLIRESLEEARPKNPLRKDVIKTFTDPKNPGQNPDFLNPNVAPSDVDPIIDLMGITGADEEQFKKIHNMVQGIPAVKRLWDEFIKSQREKITIKR